MNASPDVLAQLNANPDLQPGRSVRDTALAAIIIPVLIVILVILL